jgi:hypothetical protein
MTSLNFVVEFMGTSFVASNVPFFSSTLLTSLEFVFELVAEFAVRPADKQVLKQIARRFCMGKVTV